MPGSPICVLSVSYERSLLDTRRELLHSRGFAVISASSLLQAIKCCESGRHLDLLLLCHSIPDKDKELLIKVVRANCPAPVIMLTRGLPTSEHTAYVVIDPDPETLLDSISSLVRGSGAAA